MDSLKLIKKIPKIHPTFGMEGKIEEGVVTANHGKTGVEAPLSHDGVHTALEQSCNFGR